MLQVRNRFRDGGLGHVDVPRGFAHAAGLHDRHQDIEVTQFEAALDAVVPGHGDSSIPNHDQSIG